MKIKVVSDLHLEFSKKDMELPNNGADVLILSGDIALGWEIERYKDFFERVSEQYAHVIYVAGNHEFYHGDFQTVIASIKAQIRNWKLDNVHMLENELLKIDDVTFLGCTLWTDFNDNDEASKYIVDRSMNDYRIVNNGNFKLNPDDTYAVHAASKTWIFNQLDRHPEDKFVVVGHMAPSARSVAPAFREDIHVNGAYKSDLDSEIEKRPQIKLWTHGHMHANSDYIIGSTRIIANPRGYFRYEENPKFDPELIVEI